MAASPAALSLGNSCGRNKPPSGARPSSRMSVNGRGFAPPRVLTLSMGFSRAPESRSLQLFQPDPRHPARHHRKLLDLSDRGVDALLARLVGEHDDIDLLFALRWLALHHRVDR